MMAFYEAVQGYSQMRGAFFSYASVHIKSRLIDYARKERKHKNLTPLETADGDEDEMSVTDKLTDGSDHAEEFSERNAARSEIEKFTKELEEFGLSLSDVSDHCPQQQRTLEACRKALDYAKENQEILDEFLRTKRLPIAQLSLGGGVERKTLERHRKYMVALLLACTNGFEIIRGHIKLVLSSEKI